MTLKIIQTIEVVVTSTQVIEFRLDQIVSRSLNNILSTVIFKISALNTTDTKVRRVKIKVNNKKIE